jgi:hypothetical protein
LQLMCCCECKQHCVNIPSRLSSTELLTGAAASQPGQVPAAAQLATAQPHLAVHPKHFEGRCAGSRTSHWSAPVVWLAAAAHPIFELYMNAAAVAFRQLTQRGMFAICSAAGTTHVMFWQ